MCYEQNTQQNTSISFCNRMEDVTILVINISHSECTKLNIMPILKGSDNGVLHMKE